MQEAKAKKVSDEEYLRKLQSEAPFIGTYTSQSSQLVGILKSMRDTFKANLAAATTAEAQQLAAFKSLTTILDAAKADMTVINIRIKHPTSNVFTRP